MDAGTLELQADRRQLLLWEPAPAARWMYPRHYPWILAMGMLDVMFTWLILALGGRELNIVADAVITHGGLVGVMALKLGAIGVVVGVCEFVGRQRELLGRRVAALAVGLNTVPASVGLLCLGQFGLGLLGV